MDQEKERMTDKEKLVNEPENNGSEQVTAPAEEPVSTIFVKHEYNDRKPISKKKKTVKNIVFVAVSVILIAALTVGIVKWDTWFPETSDDGGEKPTLTFTIMDLDPNTVDTVHIKNEANDYVIKANDEEKSFWVIDGVDKTLTSASLIDGFITNLCQLEVTGLIAENCEDLSVYGLDKPTRTAVITFNDDTAPITVTVGAALPMSSGNYLKISTSNNVYSVSNTVIDYYDHYKEDFAELSIYKELTKPTTDEYYFSSAGIARYDYIKLSGKMYPTPVEFAVNNGVASEYLPYKLVKPHERPADNETVTKMLDFFVAAFSADSLVSYEATDIELEAFGFKDPLCVFEVKAAGVTRKFTLGTIINNSDPYYTLMVDDRKQVFTAKTEDFSFLSGDITDLYNDTIVTEDIYTVNALTIESEGKKHRFDLVHKEDSDPDVTAKTTTVTYNGKTLDTPKFKTLYTKVLISNLQEFVTEAEVTTPVMTITFSHIDEKLDDTVVRLYTYTDRRLLVTVNGTPIGYVLNSSVTDIKTALSELLAE